MHVPTISYISDWRDKTVLLRCGMNVPLESDGSIADDFRLERVLPMISYLQEQEAKVVVMSHIGREQTDSLAPVADYLAQHLDVVFKENFFKECSQEQIDALQQEINEAPQGTVFVLDNLRQSEKEKSNDQEIAIMLSSLGEVYVNESFSVAHREHMSMHALPAAMPNALAGFACSEEIEQLSMALNPPRQSIAVISGNKFDTKLPLIQKFVKTYQTVVVGGALANTLYALSGYEVGKSLYEDDLAEATKQELLGLLDDEKLYVPAIVVCGQGNGEKEIKHISEVGPDEYIYDCAPEGLVELEQTIQDSGLVVWNGPLGYYEGGYSEGTERLLELVSQSSAQSIIGGGNTVDAARDLGYEDKVSFLSTGGGAMIDFLTNGILPALEQLHTT